MSKTVLITGSSTGIGRSSVQLFQARGWNVIATMRSPEKGSELKQLDNVLVNRLDVTDFHSIQSAISEGLKKFGRIDALVNNAGYGAVGPLEIFPMDRIKRQFDTNVIGLIAVTQAVIPHFRAQKSGVIVNISSIGGQMTFPLFSLYHGTKFAVEGITESLYYEMEAIGVKVKIVEPGAIRTDFGTRSLDVVSGESVKEYHDLMQAMVSGFNSSQSSEPEVVAEVIWNAVTDGTQTIRYRAGEDAVQILDTRKAADDATFMKGVKSRFGL